MSSNDETMFDADQKAVDELSTMDDRNAQFGELVQKIKSQTGDQAGKKRKLNNGVIELIKNQNDYINEIARLRTQLQDLLKTNTDGREKLISEYKKTLEAWMKILQNNNNWLGSLIEKVDEANQQALKTLPKVRSQTESSNIEEEQQQQGSKKQKTDKK